MRDAGIAMREIVDSVSQVSAIVQRISAQGASQTTGLGEISNSVHRLDEMTQQNAALVQGSSNAAQELRIQATELQDRISRFRLAAA